MKIYYIFIKLFMCLAVGCAQIENAQSNNQGVRTANKFRELSESEVHDFMNELAADQGFIYK